MCVILGELCTGPFQLLFPQRRDKIKAVEKNMRRCFSGGARQEGFTLNEELKGILEKFAASGWELIAEPAQAWLEGRGDRESLLASIEQANRECGSCGCELDPLYRRALALRDAL